MQTVFHCHGLQLTTLTTSSHNLWGGLIFATPLPKSYKPFRSVLYPFNESVWIAIVLSFVAIAHGIYVIAKLEFQNMLGLSKYQESIWYTFGALVGENVKWSEKCPASLRFMSISYGL